MPKLQRREGRATVYFLTPPSDGVRVSNNGEEWFHFETSRPRPPGREDWGDGWDYGVNYVWHQGASCFGGFVQFILGLTVISLVVGGCMVLFE